MRIARPCVASSYANSMTERIGVHLGTAGGASNAVERARETGRC